MSCRDFEPLVMSYLDGELVEDERLRVEAHLTSCSGCAGRMNVARHNRTLVRSLGQQGSPRAPASLRASVFSRIHDEGRRQRQRRALKLSAAAAGVALCAVVGQQQWRSFQRRLYVDDAATRHARKLPLEVRLPQPEALEAWFDGKLGHRVAVPSFPNATAAGARVLNVREKQAAYIRYDAPHGDASHPRQLGLFVFPDNGNDVDVGARGAPDLRNSNGYNVVSWREGDLVYQLVTDLDEQDLKDLLPPEAGSPGAETRAASRFGGPGVPVEPRPAIEVRPASFQPAP